MPKKDNGVYQSLPHQTYRKSLDSFKAGLNNPEPARNKSTFFAWTATGTGLAVAGALFLSFYPFSSTFNQPSGDTVPNELYDEQEDRDESPQEAEENEATLDEIGEDEALIEELFARDALMPDASESFSIHHDEFQVMLPNTLSRNASEELDEKATKTTFTRRDTETASLYLFEEGVSAEHIDAFAEEILSGYEFTSMTTVPNAIVTDYVQSIGNGYFNNSLFSDSDTAIFSMKNENTGRFYEFYQLEVFNRHLIFFADYPLADADSEMLSYFLLGNLSPTETPYVIEEGEIDPAHGLPKTKEMFLREGALPRWESITFTLTQIEGLPFTPYLVEDAETEEITHDGFTEWRIRESDTTDLSFYSIGKMDDSFDSNQSKEILMNGFGIDLAHLEDIDGLATNENFSFYNTIDYSSGSFLLYYYEDNWYFTYVQTYGDAGARSGSFFDKREILAEVFK